MNTPPNTKNYLRCLLIGGTFSIRGKGLYIYICTHMFVYTYYIHIKYCINIIYIYIGLTASLFSAICHAGISLPQPQTARLAALERRRWSLRPPKAADPWPFEAWPWRRENPQKSHGKKHEKTMEKQCSTMCSPCFLHVQHVLSSTIWWWKRNMVEIDEINLKENGHRTSQDCTNAAPIHPRTTW